MNGGSGGSGGLRLGTFCLQNSWWYSLFENIETLLWLKLMGE
jgi:hypothetical protein